MRRLAIAVLFAVMLSGCTALPGGLLGGGDQGPDAQGLSISLQQLESFSLEGEEVTLQLRAENVGQGTAQDIRAQIFGAFSSDSTNLGALQGIDRAAGQSGESLIHEWSRTTSGDVAEGETETLETGVKVTYDYDTRAVIPVQLDPESFVTSTSTVSVGNTAAPVQVSSDLESPIPTGGEETEFSIPITVTNAGEGELESDVSLAPELVDPPSEVSLDCGGSPVTLSVTDEGTTTCTLSVPEDGVPFQTEVQIRVTAAYTYSQETTTTVSIRGTS